MWFDKNTHVIEIKTALNSDSYLATCPNKKLRLYIGVYITLDTITMTPDLATLASNFRECAKLAGILVPETAIVFEQFSAPHKPPSSLPKNRFAVYAFFWNGQCLKVGKVGQNSQARFTSQHYLPSSSNSNLAKSVLAHKEELGLNALTETTVGSWIKENTERVNFIVDAQLGVPVLTLLEVFLQCALSPRFEGFASQRTQ